MLDFLSNAHILIVDDFSGFRETIKNMLQHFRIKKIDQASNGYDALRMCSDKNYQIIFCDYNLGEGPDGQQILEELHQRAIIPRGTLFLMVTAETTMAQVIGAIEYRPDSYLTKPFTGDQLGKRLFRLIERNIALRPIYDMIATGDLYHARKICDDIMLEKPKFRLSCLRIKSELFEETNKPELALKIYNDVIDEQPLLWAQMGVGRNLYEKGEFEKARDYFIEIRSSFQQQVNIFDWIAKCQEAMGDTGKAETTLLEATAISPKSLMRQASLGKVAASLKHLDVAQKAFLSALHEGNYSCMLKPQHFRHFYENTRKLSKNAKSLEKTNLLNQTEKIIKNMERKYREDPSAIAPNLSTVAKYYADEGMNDRVSAMLSKLEKVLEHEECILSSEDTNVIGQNLQQLPDNEKANKFIDSISTRISEMKVEITKNSKSSQTDEPLIETLPPDSLFSDSDMLQVAKKVNKEGLDLIEEKKPVLALGKFRDAMEMAPENVSFSLNAAHIILTTPSLYKLPNLVEEARQLLDKSDYSDENATRRKRYKALMEKLTNAEKLLV